LGMEVLDELRPGLAERDGPGAGVAVCIAGVGEHVAEADPDGGHRSQDGRERPDGVVAA
jgi:hypothetical protein